MPMSADERAREQERAAERVRSIERGWQEDPLRREISAAAIAAARALYLVGGAVRDLLLGRPVGDWDLAGHGMIDFARRFADEHDLRVVILHEDFPTARVILQPGDPRGFVDFVELRAPEIEADLRARDFTINALAWDVRGAEALVDPTGGVEDLAARLVRAPERAVLAADPLRTLRAFRFAAELGFGIDLETGGWLRELAPRVWEVPGERIGAELLKLFAAPHAADAIQTAEELGTLESFFPMMAAMRGVEQGGYHHLDVLGHTLLTLHEAERVINEPEVVFPRSATAVRAWAADPGNRAAVRLAALFHDVGKPECRARIEGQMRFLGHADASAHSFAQFAESVALPTHLRRQVMRMVRLHMRPLELANAGIAAEDEGLPAASAITIRAIRRLMRDAEPAGIGLLLVAVGDRSACRGPASSLSQRVRQFAIFDDMLVRYADWLREHHAQPSLLSGTQLMAELGIAEGPLVGELLDAISEAWEDREITTRAQALSLARRLLRRREP